LNVKRVSFLRAIDCDNGDAIAAFDQNGFVRFRHFTCSSFGV